MGGGKTSKYRMKGGGKTSKYMAKGGKTSKYMSKRRQELNSGIYNF